MRSRVWPLRARRSRRRCTTPSCCTSASRIVQRPYSPAATSPPTLMYATPRLSAASGARQLKMPVRVAVDQPVGVGDVRDDRPAEGDGGRAAVVPAQRSGWPLKRTTAIVLDGRRSGRSVFVQLGPDDVERPVEGGQRVAAGRRAMSALSSILRVEPAVQPHEAGAAAPGEAGAARLERSWAITNGAGVVGLRTRTLQRARVQQVAVFLAQDSMTPAGEYAVDRLVAVVHDDRRSAPARRGAPPRPPSSAGSRRSRLDQPALRRGRSGRLG
jgi:hypothetical protein